MLSKTIVYTTLSIFFFGSQSQVGAYPTSDIKLSENELKFVKTGIENICDENQCNLEYILGRADHCVKLILQSKDCGSKEINLQSMEDLAESFKDDQTKSKRCNKEGSCKTYKKLTNESCLNGNSFSVEFNKNEYYI
ncbi:hypothetical protein BB558_007343 [Smittium angustum]|uniref:Uncharacterized protein n=1 Tax=Smittium angustum TaxID=133377 RepID=A0A2U1IVA2_SMIAN|nr:hypothetical protein BB558_007343 [Smittium angustum]